MTKAELKVRIDTVWDARARKIDWLALEQTQRDIFNCRELSEAEALRYLAQALGAYTGRGCPKDYEGEL